MQSTNSNARRPWLAALLSLLGGPVGQIYAGRIYRSIVLWTVGALLAFSLAFAAVSFSIGRRSFSLLLLSVVCFPIYLMIDAFVVTKRHRYAPIARYQKWWVYLFAIVVFTMANLAVALTVRTYIAEAFVIPNRAMAPTLRAGDRILVDKLWRQRSRLQRGDVVVFWSAGVNSPLYVKRLVGLPGDRIEIADEKVFLNGKEMPDPHAVIDLELVAHPELTNCGPLVVPDNSIFVLGDNRRLSKDSRIMGPIPLADFYGTARVIYWSQERVFPEPGDTSIYELNAIGWSRIGKRLD